MIAVTMKWVLTFQRQGIADDETYYLEIDAAQYPEDFVTKIRNALMHQNYSDVKYRLKVTFPP
jgi:hypothetical protein